MNHLAVVAGLICIGAALAGVPARADTTARVAVVVGRDAPELERFAAEELCRYVEALFGIECEPRLHAPKRAGVVLRLATDTTVAEQAIVMRRADSARRQVLEIAGGSPRATLWAVYTLAEEWGVRYLLREDVVPPRQAFWLPDADIRMEPELPIRQWRVVNDFACGPESWGMGDYRPVLDQLAKLKFSRILVSIWPWQPFVDYEYGGVKRSSATLWFGFRYPVTDDMIGRELFGDVDEFWNPDLPRGAGYEELAAAGERLLHELMAYAHSRGLECVLTMHLTEYPAEFAEALPKWERVHQLAEMTVVPAADVAVEDPTLNELAATVLRAAVDTYPEVDAVAVGMPEWRQWSDHYEPAWVALDAKYGIEATRPLEQVIAHAGNRTGYPGGAERALAEVKGDIVALYFYDRLLRENHALASTTRPDMPLVMMSVAEELFPVLGEVMPEGWEVLNFVDYTASRVVKRREVLADLPGEEVPASLIYTLHDDNVGLLPQLATTSLHELTTDLRRHGWAGFSTRYWLTGDHDPCVAYLARAAWDETATPEGLYREQIAATCGEASVEDMLTLYRELEAVTISLEGHGLGLTFPVPGMIERHFTPAPISEALVGDREGYARALAAAERALEACDPEGRAHVEYWIGRLQFGIGYIDMLKAVRASVAAEQDGRPSEAEWLTREAMSICEDAVGAYADVAKDRSDVGAIAVLNEYVYRPLKARLARLNGVVAHGLLRDYDFTRGSGPDASGAIRDLTGSGRDATIRPATPSGESTDWAPHAVLQGDGEGGRIALPARIRSLRKPEGVSTIPFGLARTASGTVVLLCSWNDGESERPIISLSDDDGESWSEFEPIPGAHGRPMNLVSLGGERFTFVAGRRFFSDDGGRTWPESVDHAPTASGRPFHLEGNAWVDLDENGRAARLMEIGWHYEPGKHHPIDDATCVFRSSADGGRTWTNEVAPAQWKFTLPYKGQDHLRGVSEGAIVRAANGWLVAALRTDMPPRYFDEPHDDSLEGTGISLSKDDGQTWSVMDILFDAGRHHANLSRLPNGDLVCVTIVRDDVRGGELASPMRGCDALVSHDNGETWNLDRRFTLDEWEYLNPDYWVDGQCGHLASVPMPDGSVLTAYGHYRRGAAVLVKWDPDTEPIEAIPPKPDSVESVSILDLSAAEGRDYERADGGIWLGGSSWIDVPLDEALLSLEGDGTLELVLAPENQGGFVSLVRCAHPTSPDHAFWIAYDLRDPEHSNQVIFSDERPSQADPFDYSVQVGSGSIPAPFAELPHQIAYVVEDGVGAFYRDGEPLSEQTKGGEVGRERLIRYCRDHAEDLRLAIGGSVSGQRIGSAFRGTVLAARIYDRALTGEELKRNRAATLGP